MTVPWRPAQRSPIATRDRAELYETPEALVLALLGTGELNRFRGSPVWEPAVGRGAVSRTLRGAGFKVIAQDLIAHPGADADIRTPVNFLAEQKAPKGVRVAVTNPPFRFSDQFIRHGLVLGLTLIVLLRLQAFEGVRRSDLIDGHLRRVYVGRTRPPMMHRKGWKGKRVKLAGQPFMWAIFEPGVRSLPFSETYRISWPEDSAS